MNILGIETSCDETAAAIVSNGRKILSNIVTSSLKEHKKYGGIIPEIASRRQIELINLVVQRALDQAKLTLNNVNAIAVTTKPGLIGSLLVGISFARALSFAAKKPLIEVDHIKAHLYANFLEGINALSENAPLNKQRPKLPALGLVVSGGHSSLFHIRSFKDYRLLGETRDDAVGETFDKVARMMELGYPGGPVIDRLARTGENTEIHFSCADLPKTLDFSFSGIKTAVLYYVRDHKMKKDFSPEKIAFAFQDSVTTVLVNKSLRLCKEMKIPTLLIGGGVAANSMLRKKLSVESKKQNIRVFLPSLGLCMDNAAMIAGLGYHLI
ncbi:MAG: tRNA (adenosine(37)-N6)-threonylcarbamoyltransferase complex transferase subunit TsaD [Candidatus Omnitrophota bacterium]